MKVIENSKGNSNNLIIKILKNNKSSVNTYFAIIMPVLIILVMVMTEFINIKSIMNKTYEAQETSLESIQTLYKREIYDKYGIFVLYENENLGRKYKEIFTSNLKGDNILVDNHTFALKNQLNEEILFQQIKEERKIIGVIDMSKDLKNIMTGFKEIDSALSSSADIPIDNTQSLLDVQVENLNNNKTKISDLEMQLNNGDGSVQVRIDQLKEENREILLNIENLQGSIIKNTTEEDNKSKLGENIETLQEKFGQDASSLGNITTNLTEGLKEGKDYFEKIRTLVTLDISAMYEEILLNEYILSKFQTMVTGEGEVEHILYGADSKKDGIINVFFFRSIFNFIGHLTIDTKAPPEGISRLIYSITAGLLTGSEDTIELLTKEDGRVPIVNIIGDTSSLKNIKISYRNQLQLFLLLETKESKLKRVLEYINTDINKMGETKAMTTVNAKFKGKIRLKYLKILPDNTKFLNGYKKGDYFYYEREIEKSFI